MDLKAEIMLIFWGRNIGHVRNWDELGDEVVKVCQHHMNSYIPWQHNELENAKEDIQELEIDLMLAREEQFIRYNKIHDNVPQTATGSITFKKRSNFEL